MNATDERNSGVTGKITSTPSRERMWGALPEISDDDPVRISSTFGEVKNKTLDDVQDFLGVYPFLCDCGDQRHSLVITALDERIIAIGIYDTPPTFWERLKATWRMLRHGEWDGEMIVRVENVEALVHTLRRAAFPAVVADADFWDSEMEL